MPQPNDDIARDYEFPGKEQTDFGQPPEGRGRTWRWVLGSIAVIAAAYFLNRYMARHQTLHVVNRLPGEVTVTIDGEKEGIRVGRRRETVSISEGAHEAVIRGEDGMEMTVEFEIRNSLLQRFFRDSAFILNPGGAASFIWEETVYTANPGPADQGSYQVHFGEEFLVLRDIDYAFEAFPSEISTESSRVTKRRVDVLDAPPMQVMGAFPDGTERDEYLRFAEHHLTLDPADEALLKTYSVLSAGMDQLDRCRAFLETGLARKPVVIEWHRLYQGMSLAAGDEQATIARYDQLLADDPDSSALLYLRGRLAPRATEACAYYDRAIAADADNPYPHFAKGQHLFGQLQFEEAKPLAAKAVELMPGHADMENALFEIRFALGEYADLEAESKKTLLENPGDLGTQERLLRVLVAGGRVEEANKAHEQYAQQVGVPKGPDDTDLALQSDLALCYFTGDLEGWLSRAEKLSGPDSDNSVAGLAHLELGNLEEAAKELGEDPSEHSGYSALLFSLAWKQKGNQAERDRWRQAAIDSFASTPGNDALVAELLGQGDQVDLGEVDDLWMQRESKTLVLVALADASSTHRKALLDRAEKLNTVGAFPYQFLKRAIEAMRNEGAPAAASP